MTSRSPEARTPGAPGAAVERFALRDPGRWRLPLLVYGVRRDNAYVELRDGWLEARFGWARLRTPLANVVDHRVTGPYKVWRALGLRVSLSDTGISFGTTARGGVCVRFRRPVRVIVRHPNLTVTVKDIAGFSAALRRHGVPLASPPG